MPSADRGGLVIDAPMGRKVIASGNALGWVYAAAMFRPYRRLISGVWTSWPARGSGVPKHLPRRWLLKLRCFGFYRTRTRSQ